VFVEEQASKRADTGVDRCAGLFHLCRALRFRSLTAVIKVFAAAPQGTTLLAAAGAALRLWTSVVNTPARRLAFGRDLRFRRYTKPSELSSFAPPVVSMYRK
jgi:hypothetical protein